MRGARSGGRVAGIITRVDEELDASFAADCRAAGGDICRWRLLVVRARAAVGALLAAAHRQYMVRVGQHRATQLLKRTS